MTILLLFFARFAKIPEVLDDYSNGTNRTLAKIEGKIFLKFLNELTCKLYPKCITCYNIFLNLYLTVPTLA